MANTFLCVNSSPCAHPRRRLHANPLGRGIVLVEGCPDCGLVFTQMTVGALCSTAPLPIWSPAFEVVGQVRQLLLQFPP
jgi:hypothetical protein